MSGVAGVVGKIALVTGASSGIGAAVAVSFAKAGAAVAVNYRNGEAEALAVVARIEAAGGLAMAVRADVSRPDDVERIAASVVERFGHIDILVNNAGTIEAESFGAIGVDSFERQFAANVLSVLMTMQAAVRYMPPEGGRIINISSSLAQSPLPGTVVYSASKAAVNMLTIGFSKELGAKNITVNAVAPGATATRMTAKIDSEIWDGIARRTPLGRCAAPQDTADAVLFLASDAARFITGRILTVDGGLV